MSTTQYIVTATDPAVPNTFTISGATVLLGLDLSGALVPTLVNLEAGLNVVADSVTPKKAKLDAGLYLVTNGTPTLSPKVAQIAPALYVVNSDGALSAAQIDAALLAAVGAAGLFHDGAGGTNDANRAHAAVTTSPTATAATAPTLTPLVADA